MHSLKSNLAGVTASRRHATTALKMSRKQAEPQSFGLTSSEQGQSTSQGSHSEKGANNGPAQTKLALVRPSAHKPFSSFVPVIVRPSTAPSTVSFVGTNSDHTATDDDLDMMNPLRPTVVKLLHAEVYCGGAAPTTDSTQMVRNGDVADVEARGMNRAQEDARASFRCQQVTEVTTCDVDLVDMPTSNKGCNTSILGSAGRISSFGSQYCSAGSEVTSSPTLEVVSSRPKPDDAVGLEPYNQHHQDHHHRDSIIGNALGLQQRRANDGGADAFHDSRDERHA